MGRLRTGELGEMLALDAEAAKRGLVRVPGRVLGGPKAVAYANHGRWVIDCPFGCGNARMAYEGVGFWCDECGNAEVGGQELDVVWPDDRDDIEDVLARRPREPNRNWFPHESVPQLRVENQRNGVD
jgi:hypothetical protein